MTSEDEAQGVYYLWRFMVGGEHQGQGYGRRAMELLIERIKTLPKAKDITLSVVPTEAGAEGFYRRFSFVRTGEKHGVEVEMRLTF